MCANVCECASVCLLVSARLCKRAYARASIHTWLEHFKPCLILNLAPFSPDGAACCRCMRGEFFNASVPTADGRSIGQMQLYDVGFSSMCAHEM
eukprot:3037696-Pleurochrysis_carterae.AAC.2